MLRIIAFTFFVLTASVSANDDAPLNKKNDGIQWDFDHQIQFIKTTISEHEYQLKIIPNNKVPFDRLSVFLLRKSYSLCQRYDYKLEILQGVEGFDDKRSMPNYIAPSLVANVECNP